MKYFSKPSFRDWQLRIVSATIETKNSLVVMPAGSGKSLCCQFPAVVTGKLSIVLMPTISLIMDQVHHLQTSGLRLTHLRSMQTDRGIINKIAQDDYHIVFCTPESTNTAFNKLPDTTNAVESHNRCSKGSCPDILKVALMATYKIDMSTALEHLAKRRGIRSH